jgi:hypothetical protein
MAFAMSLAVVVFSVSFSFTHFGASSATTETMNETHAAEVAKWCDTMCPCGVSVKLVDADVREAPTDVNRNATPALRRGSRHGRKSIYEDYLVSFVHIVMGWCFVSLVFGGTLAELRK